MMKSTKKEEEKKEHRETERRIYKHKQTKINTGKHTVSIQTERQIDRHQTTDKQVNKTKKHSKKS